jgi:CRP-like cAMP-binding protein
MSLNIFEYVNNLAVEIHTQGDIIFREGDESNGRMYFVAEGELSVLQNVNGRTIELNRLQAGSFFGEMAIITHGRRMATVRVESKKAKLGYLDEQIFMKIGKINPLFLYSLLKLVINRLAMIEEQIDKALTKRANNRS